MNRLLVEKSAYYQASNDLGGFIVFVAKGPVIRSLIAASALALVVLPAGTASAKGGPPSHDRKPGPIPSGTLTDEQIGRLTPPQIARLLGPLRAIANAVGQAGATTDSDIYGNLYIDANRRRVDVYVTTIGQASRLIAHAKTLDHSIDTHRIRVLRSAFTKKDLRAAQDHILTLNAEKALPYKVYSTAIAIDSSGLQVGVSAPSTARRLARRSTGPASIRALSATTPDVPITFTKGAMAKGASWSNVKWHDSTPFIGGDTITDGNKYCTTGLPAIRNSDGATVMVTADHCFKNGAQVYTANGTVGTLNGSTGNWVGQRTSATQEFDAEILVGTNNNADESDTSGWKPLTRYAYSYNGDYVCQDGAASFFDYWGKGTSPTPCNIKVTDEDITWTMDDAYGTSHDTRGVQGKRTSSSNSNYAVCEGDSGGTVFTAVNSDWSTSAREARGIVSASDKAPCDTTIYWTEATDIFNRLGLHLNPTT